MQGCGWPKDLSASMRPPQIAGEKFRLPVPVSAGSHASMRPPQIAGEKRRGRRAGRRSASGFNEAPADRGGKVDTIHKGRCTPEELQ